MKVRLEEFERKEKLLKNTNPWALMRAASKDGISTKYRLGDHTYS